MAAGPSPRDAVKTLEESWQLVIGNAGPSVHDLEVRVVVHHVEAHGDGALERELEGVREKVQDNLLPHVAIDMNGFGQGGAIDDEPEPCPLDRRTKAARKVRGKDRKI